VRADPEELSVSPLAAVGLEEVHDDPAGIPPPRGAVRTFAAKRQVGDQVRLEANYVWSGQVADAVEYYSSALKSRRYELQADRSARGGRVLLYAGAGGQVVVALRSRPPEAKMDNEVNIVVTVLRPAE